MRRCCAFLLAFGCAAVLGACVAPAAADDDKFSCSTKSVAGRWLFATEVGTIKFDPDGDGPAGLIVRDITALGTMNIDRNGVVDGVFDATIFDFAVSEDATYTGSIWIEPDCTGTLEFVTSAGSSRTDKIAVVGRSEMLGMSLVAENIWNYQIRRLPNLRDRD